MRPIVFALLVLMKELMRVHRSSYNDEITAFMRSMSVISHKAHHLNLSCHGLNIML